ncbi:uncharacterized protein LOC107412490 isoform X1 [Ziziphus jujuba]|uniref:Uncharacterized protein LOC107412490 isoform X1 n=1 Tax=Ziziphus jujuba TaxID=326968 RepID=A0ABM3ZU74_ZIZJJ|nr:uncharacterized protein LOC107412490 isoform X1 [Ziziphus jujuba]
MENLREDLLVEILVRTSEKDLVRCKCVCKLWHRIISKEANLLLRRFWPNSPISGIYFRTLLLPKRSQFTRPCCSRSERLSYIDFLIQFSDVTDINFVSLAPETEPERIQPSWILIDYCNGLELLFDSSFWQYVVFNPTTKQQSYIPKAFEHSKKFHFLVALAFDPIESLHYRVVRMSDAKPIGKYEQIGPNASLVLDVFSSETGHWVRHRLQLGTIFTRNSVLFWRHFTYIRGVLYWMVSSSNILCIDFNNLAKTPTRLLHVPYREKAVLSRVNNSESEVNSADMCKIGCLGVSMNHLYHCRRISKLGAFCVWFYVDDGNSNGPGEWVLKFSVSYRYLQDIIFDYLSLRRKIWIEPIAVSPTADVLFIGTKDWILSYHFESKKLQLVYGGAPNRGVDCYFFPLSMLRKCTCLVQFYKLGEGTAVSTPLNLVVLKDYFALLTKLWLGKFAIAVVLRGQNIGA